MKRSLPGRSGRAAFAGALFLLLLMCVFPALGEISVSFTPAAPRVGDYVDITVDPGEEEVRGVLFRLYEKGKLLFAGRDPVKRLTASFRPRKEGTFELEVTVIRRGNRRETAAVTVSVAGTAPEQQGATFVYSQTDGWWKQPLYEASYTHTLESSGCAVFMLSEALQRMGLGGSEALPESLAGEYGKYYTEGTGARTEAMITQAGLHFGFETVHLPVKNADEILSFLRRGDLFCLGPVPRHVVLADRADAESRKVHVIDSWPEATFNKLGGTPAWIPDEDGTWQKIRSADEIPGIRWFFESGRFGGAEYWLDLDFCALRGMRLIRRPWLTLKEEGGKTFVTPEAFGTAESTVTVNGESRNVPTACLSWFCEGADGPMLAVVTREQGAAYTERNGDAVRKRKPLPSGSAACALWVEEDRVYVWWRGTYGYLRREDVELTAPQAGADSGK